MTSQSVLLAIALMGVGSAGWWIGWKIATIYYQQEGKK